MSEIGLVDRLNRMCDRKYRHDYDIGDFWNAVGEAAGKLTDLQTALAASQLVIDGMTKKANEALQNWADAENALAAERKRCEELETEIQKWKDSRDGVLSHIEEAEAENAALREKLRAAAECGDKEDEHLFFNKIRKVIKTWQSIRTAGKEEE